MKQFFGIVAAAIVLGFAGKASAQMPPEPFVEWEKRQNVEERLTALGDDLMGDRIDPHTGSLSFEQTDVSIPGNFDIPVALTRRLSPGFLYDDGVDTEFGDWEYVVPRIKVTSIIQRPFDGNRCSESFDTQFPMTQISASGLTTGNPQTTFMIGAQYTNGVKLDVPGYGSQEILEVSSGGMWPAGATHGTTQNWYLRCGSASDGGEGFIGYAPNGDRYTFDRVIVNDAPRMGYGTRGLVARKVFILAATEVRDVHGNTVNYTYDNSDRLTRISASDGRQIDINYSGASSLVSSVTAHGRTWTYQYRANGFEIYDWAPHGYIPGYPLNGKVLSGVTLPDGRSWSFTLDSMAATPSPSHRCGNPVNDLTLTHPSGATGTFSRREIEHRNFTYPLAVGESQCPMLEPTPGGGPGGTLFTQRTSTAMISVTEKELSGPGTPTATWTYRYESDTGTSTAGERTNWTEIAGPGNHVTFFHYWTTEENGGKLKRQEVRSSAGGAVLRSTEYEYLMEANVGTSFFGVTSHPGDVKRPVRTTKVTTTQDGATYETISTFETAQSSNNYSYGSPITVRETSPSTSSDRVTNTTYAHNKTKWIIGLTDTITRNGKLFDDFDYDTLGNLVAYKKFGSVAAALAYDSDGTLLSYTDALGATTSLSNYYRGMARTMQLPPTPSTPTGTTLTRTVSDHGELLSFTDGKQNTTSFSYNSSGWLTGITRPGGFAGTTITYTGLGGGLVQTSQRGNAKTIISYDRFHRPFLIETQDLTGNSASAFVSADYDALGREVFTSLPSYSAAGSAGRTTGYDALGRVTQTQETYAPYATTFTDYLSNNTIRVTDPEGGITTTTYRAFGAPATDEPVSVLDPTGTTTSLSRDIYGNITQLYQSSGLNGYTVDVTRNFWYDDRLRLCRHRAPEFGHELFEYDAKDQLIKQSRGDTPGSTCAIPSSAIATRYEYDALGRQTRIDYPLGSDDISKEYDPNGNVTKLYRGGRNWRYWYNELNLLERESLYIDGLAFTTRHNYNADGSILSRELPNGQLAEFDPDGLGRPTELLLDGVSLVDAITYHTNGMVADAYYGNGYSYTQNLNSRQLPFNIRVHTPGRQVWLRYGYDKRGKITEIEDLAVAGQDRAFTYDARGRLTQATGSWGVGTYSYDGLDNLRRKTLGNRTVDLTYDMTRNRLTSALDSREGTPRTISYDPRGNMAQNGAITLMHDWSNQPVTMTGPANTVQHVYDGQLKRVKSIEDGETTYWVYSALTGTPIYSENITTGEVSQYLDSGGVRIQIIDGVVTWTHLDHQGSAIAATDSAGVMQWREHYTPFGEKLLDPTANKDRPGYTGHIQDDWSGLTYMQARYYDTVLGRFLQTDPIGYQDQLNLYAYVGNDPVNKTDPTGEFGIAGAFIGGGIELGAQLFSKSGRESWGKGLQALRNGDLSGTLDAVGGNLTKLGLAAGAGALGQVGAQRLGQATSKLAQGASSVRNAERTKLAGDVAGNAVIGGALGGTEQALRNELTGENGNIGLAIIGGAAGGATGSTAESTLRGSTQLGADATGKFMSNSKGQTAAPGATNGAAAAAGEAAGNVYQRNLQCSAGDTCS